jgi:hypothetical protein
MPLSLPVAEAKDADAYYDIMAGSDEDDDYDMMDGTEKSNLSFADIMSVCKNFASAVNKTNQAKFVVAMVKLTEYASGNDVNESASLEEHLAGYLSLFSKHGSNPFSTTQDEVGSSQRLRSSAPQRTAASGRPVERRLKGRIEKVASNKLKTSQKAIRSCAFCKYRSKWRRYREGRLGQKTRRSNIS